MFPRTMGDVIDELLSLAASRGVGLYYRAWYHIDRPEVARFFDMLELTGPLFHRGAVYRIGEGETYCEGIDVIKDVRIAAETPVPTVSPDLIAK